MSRNQPSLKISIMALHDNAKRLKLARQVAIWNAKRKKRDAR